VSPPHGAEPAPIPFTQETLERSIPERFRAMVEIHASRTAIHHGGARWTYEDLDARAGAIAARVRAAAGAPGGIVALRVPQSADLIAAMLGILEAGHAYVPLYPGEPPGAIRAMLQRIEARAVVASADRADEVTEPAAGLCPIVTLDPAWAPAPSERARPRVPPGALACVYFTSGTTGAPKGVMDVHRNVLHNVMRYTRTLGFGPSDRMTLLQASTFSGVASTIFGALLNGATLLPYDIRRDGIGPPLARWLAGSGATLYHSVPTIFRSVCFEAMAYPSVRLVRLEGDAAAPTDVLRFRRHFGANAVLVNGLAATETGLTRQFFLRPGDRVPDHVLPVGYPVEDVDVKILDAEGNEVASGDSGEIVACGRYLSPGYWRDDARTARAFRPDPNDAGMRRYHSGDGGRMRADGCVEHRGRQGDQIKIHGEWIDLPWIERACERVPGVEAAAVAAGRAADGEAVLNAYLVPSGDTPPTFAAFRAALEHVLPPFMVPSIVWTVDALPATGVGKLDRAALETIEATRLTRDDRWRPPLDGTEEALAAIWRHVLKVPQVGRFDRFSDLGGDSLSAAAVLTEIETQLGRTLSLGELLEAHTVADLAGLLRDEGRALHHSALIHVQPSGAATPLFCVHDLESDAFLFAALARRLGRGQPLFALRYRAGEPLGDVPRSLPALASRYVDDLRTVRPRGPYRLAGFCFGAVVALEMARQLEAAGEAVDRLALLNVTPFDLPDLVSAAAWRRFRTDLPARVRYLASKPGRTQWLADRLSRTIRDGIARARMPSLLRVAPPTRPARADEVRHLLQSAFRAHRAAAFHGPILLALAAETLALYTDHPAEAWRPLGGRVTLTVHPKDGYGMLSEPDVGDLAHDLARWLGAGADGPAGG
jgi:amino acid adenylation domain-containing protein